MSIDRRLLSHATVSLEWASGTTTNHPRAQLRDESRKEPLPLAVARLVHRTPVPEPLLPRAVLPRPARVFFSGRSAPPARGITRSNATTPGAPAAWRAA